MCNLTREEREFLEKAHIDVEEDEVQNDDQDEENERQSDQSEVLNYRLIIQTL